MSSDLAAIYTGLRTKMLASSGLTTLVSQRIYTWQAPDKAAYPYVTMYHAAGGYMNIVNSDMMNILISIEAWADTAIGADNTYAAIHAALHRADITVTGWSCYWCMEEVPIHAPPELYNNQRIYRAGGSYRLKLSKG